MQDGEHRRRRIRGGRGGPVESTRPDHETPAPLTPADRRSPRDDGPAGHPRRPETVAAAFAEPVAHLPVAHLPVGDPDAPHRQPVHDDRDSERGLRGLIGGGSSQVSVTAAMRARDAARPTDAEIAHAEATLAIVHRGWVPRDQP